MKTTLLRISSIIMFLTWFTVSKADDDLPPPTPNLQTIPVGSWVIAMDNTYGNGSTVGVMNLRAYGLAVELLWNAVPLKWCIRTGKAKDGIDFTANTRPRFPTPSATILSRGFMSGPLVILPADTIVAGPVIIAFNNKITGTTNDVKVYRTTTVVNNVDVRYTLNHRPFVSVYDDGGNANIHTDMLDDAMVDTSHYRVLDPGYQIDSSSCFTYASTPHWGVNDYESSDSLRLKNLKSFLLSGGNFLAECEGIDAVENFAPVRFMTTNGVTTINANPVTQLYANVDMPVMQFHGAFTQGGGSIVNFLVDKVNSNWVGSQYKGAYFLRDVIRADGSSGSDGILDSVVQVNATKISANGTIGGNIIYLGGHSYSGLTSLANINGQRVYLNGLLIPARRIIADGIIPSTLSFCQGDTIKIPFTPPSSGFTYNWTGPNGYSATIEDPVVPDAQPAKAGVYVTSIRTMERCSFNYSTNVTVNLKPVFTAATTAPLICEGDSCTISVSPTAGLTSINWYLKDTTKTGCKPIGASLYTTYSQKIAPTETGTYVAIAFNASGCKDTSCVKITVDKMPVLSPVFPTATPLCFGRGSIVNITPGYGGLGCTDTYQWRIDGGAWNTYTSGSRVGQGAIDSVEIRATRGCTTGCNKTVRLKWNVAPKQIVHDTSALLPCVNSVIGYIGTLTATNPAPSTGVWSIISGPGSIANVNSINTTVSSLSMSGVPTVFRWVVTNSYGCKDTTTTTITPPTMDSTLVSKYAKEYCLTCPVQDGNTYSYYDLNGKLLARVTDSVDAVQIGNTTFCGQLSYNIPGDPSVGMVQTVNSYIEDVGFLPQPYLPRAWNMNTTTDAPMTVRLYFTEEELAALTGASLLNGGYYDFGGAAERLLLVAYPNNSDTFVPPASPNGIVSRPQFQKIGSVWQVSFRFAQSATFYLYPPYWINFYGLPVELTTFKATADPDEQVIKLEWETASEIENEKFEIQRALNTKDFIKIGEQAGAGNQRGTSIYSFDDDEVVAGQVYYYRLKQIDYSGKFEYSNVVSAVIKAENKFSISEFLPNPTSNISVVNVSATGPTEMEINIYGIDGSMVRSEKYQLDKGESNLNIDISNLGKGLYLVQFSSSDGKWTRKLMKLD